MPSINPANLTLIKTPVAKSIWNMRNYLKRRVFVREVDRVVVELSVGVGHVGQQKEQARLVGVGVT